jgi:hypothetical protein
MVLRYGLDLIGSVLRKSVEKDVLTWMNGSIAHYSANIYPSRDDNWAQV